MLTDFCGRPLSASKTWIAGAMLVSLVCVFGCGGKPVPAEYSGPPVVSGRVSMDGAALSAVNVLFENSESGPFQTVTGADGRYVFAEGEATPSLGKYLVRITFAMGGDESSTLPPRYNTETELIIDVLPGENPIDFPLSKSLENGDETE